MSATPSLTRSAATYARRAATQYAATSRVKYTVGRIRGDGITVSCSSDEITIRTTRSLPVGRKIRLCIDWPAAINDGSVSVVVTGLVLSSATDSTAIKILHY